MGSAVSEHDAAIDFEITDDSMVGALTGSAAWWEKLAAAVSEGFCPSCHGRLIPVQSTAQAAGRCLTHGYWWTGGPDVAYAREGWSQGGQGVPR